ncbi:MAG: NAD(P) transhydrogenase subunit alpha [Acidimicrobiales bacterium]
MDATLVAALTVFVLASVVGLELISKVPPTLHTPLMSGANAVSGISIVGALVATGSGSGGLAQWLGFLAIVTATINVVGGFLVTDRMLAMFRRPRQKPTAQQATEQQATEQHDERPPTDR